MDSNHATSQNMLTAGVGLAKQRVFQMLNGCGQGTDYSSIRGKEGIGNGPAGHLQPHRGEEGDQE